MTASPDVRTDAPDQTLRDRILSAAFEAFMANGYAGTSTLDIATRAKVSKRDLYAICGSKQAMLAACIAERGRRMRVPLNLPPPATQTALSASLIAFGSTLLQEASRGQVLAVFRLAIAEAALAPDMARTLDELGRAATGATLAEWLAGAQKAGLLGAGKPSDMADLFTSLLWRGGLLVRLLLRLVEPPEPDEARRRARDATRTLLRVYPPD
jgi:AcrR family transcriptional regulator